MAVAQYYLNHIKTMFKCMRPFTFRYPCSSICLLNDLVIGGYGSGHIRVFNSASGVMLAEVCAHSRWINAMDISQESGLVRIAL